MSSKPSSETRKPVSLKLTPRGININYTELCQWLDVKNLIALKRHLVVKKPVFMGKQLIKTNIMPLYKFLDIQMPGSQGSQGSQKVLLVARQCGIIKLLKKINPSIQLKCTVALTDGEDIPEDKLEPGVDPTPNQEIVIEYLCNTVYTPERKKNGNASCILIMPTGTGKSYMGGLLIEAIRKKTLVVLPNTSMLDDWLDIFKNYYPSITVGQYHSKCKTDGDVVFTTIKSAIKEDFLVDGVKMPYYKYFERFGLLIYDEVHNYSTKAYQEIFWRAGIRCILGMTATPDERIDQMDEVYYKHLGQLVEGEKLEGYNKVDIQWKGEVEVIRYHGPPEFTQSLRNVKTGRTNVMAMHQQLGKDPYRNKLIINKLQELRQEDKFAFVYSECRNYLTKLCHEVRNANMPVSAPEIDVSKTMMGGIKPDAKKEAKKADIIMMTYGYGKEGISIPRMDAELFATPRRNKLRQVLGRVLRRGGDPSRVRRIIDIVDYNTSLRDQFSTRKRVYVEKGFTIKIIDVNYDEIML